MSSLNKSSSRTRSFANSVPGVFERPDAERVIIGDEALRLQPGALHPARQQHAERRMGETPLERIEREIEALAARKGFDEKLVGRRQRRARPLQRQPFGDLLRQGVPGGRNPTGAFCTRMAR